MDLNGPLKTASRPEFIIKKSPMHVRPEIKTKTRPLKTEINKQTEFIQKKIKGIKAGIYTKKNS